MGQQDQDNPPPQPLPVHQAIPPQIQPANNPANPVIMNEYTSFNLASVTPPVAPKWENNEFILDKYHKFQCSCRMIFDRPMAHINSGKVKTNMFLIWAGPDGQDIYSNFNLTATQCHDIDYAMQWFEEFCTPIWNFRAAHFKFTKVF